MLNIILSPSVDVDGELEKVNELIAHSDLDYFHLRKPHFDENQMRAYLEGIDSFYWYKIKIHSHFDLLFEFDLGGIHLNKKDLSQLTYADDTNACYIEPLVLKGRQIEVKRQIVDRISYSAHSVNEIKSLPFDTEYVFLSPIYNSISKKDYPSEFSDLETLSKEIGLINTSVVALSGVTLDKKEELKQTGFKGLARLGDVWR